MKTLTSLVLLFTLLLVPFLYASAPAAKPPEAKPALEVTPEMSEAEYLKLFAQQAKENRSLGKFMEDKKEIACPFVLILYGWITIEVDWGRRCAGGGAGGGGGYAF